MGDAEGFSVTGPVPSGTIGSSPELSTYSAVAGMFRRVQKGNELVTARAENFGAVTKVSNPFVPSPLGGKRSLNMPRYASGIGEFIIDPMQNFKSEKLDLEGRKYGKSTITNPGQKFDSNKLRRKGVTSYNRYKANKTSYAAGQFGHDLYTPGKFKVL
jgi:hypothetical protein